MTRTRTYAVSGLALLGALTVGVTIWGQNAPTVATDKTSYAAGDTMAISGSGFSAGTPIVLSVARPDFLTDQVLNVSADSTGKFTASYSPSSPVVAGQYKITATDGTASAVTASTVAKSEVFAVRSGSPLPVRDLFAAWERSRGVAIQAKWGERAVREREVLDPWTQGTVLPGWAPRVSLEHGLRAL